MWPNWMVLEWTLAVVGCLVFWLIVIAEIADALRRHRAHRTRHSGPYKH